MGTKGKGISVIGLEKRLWLLKVIGVIGGGGGGGGGGLEEGGVALQVD